MIGIEDDELRTGDEESDEEHTYRNKIHTIKTYSTYDSNRDDRTKYYIVSNRV